jgi:hypothetical protein
VYAPEPDSSTANANAATKAAAQRVRCAAKNSPTAARRPPINTEGASHGCHDEPDSSRYDVTAVSATPPLSKPEADGRDRSFHSWTAAVPTRAPIAGARATV